MQYVLDVSMPRSGHHYLERLLAASMEGKFGYCSYYGDVSFNTFQPCCRKVPCAKAIEAGFDLFLQKNHDWGLGLQRDSSASLLVQVRQPVPRLFSNFRLHAKNKPESDNIKGFREFAEQEAIYYVEFWKKWVLPKEGFLMVYEDLVRSPKSTLQEFFGWSDISVPEEDIDKAIAQEMGLRGRDQEAYAQPDIEKHPYWDNEFLYQFQAEIVRQCEGFDDVFGKFDELQKYRLPLGLIREDREGIQEELSKSYLSPTQIAEFIDVALNSGPLPLTEKRRFDQVIAENAALRAERDAASADRGAKKAERDAATAERDAAISERDAANLERDAAAAERSQVMLELDEVRAERDACLADARARRSKLAAYIDYLDFLVHRTLGDFPLASARFRERFRAAAESRRRREYR